MVQERCFDESLSSIHLARWRTCDFNLDGKESAEEIGYLEKSKEAIPDIRSCLFFLMMP